MSIRREFNETRKIKFNSITESVLEIISSMENASKEHSLEGILSLDLEARSKTAELLSKKAQN